MCIREGGSFLESRPLQSRRRFSSEFNSRLILDSLIDLESHADACRKHGLSPTILEISKTGLLERAHEASKATRHDPPSRLESPNRSELSVE